MPQPVSAFMFDGFGVPYRVSPAGAMVTAPAPIVLSQVVDIVRPANVTPYAAAQCWGTGSSCVFAFTGAAAAGGKGRVVSGRMSKSSPNIVNAQFRLWLNNTATLGAQPAADQAAINLIFGDRIKRVGFVTFNAFAAMGCADSPGVLSIPNGLPFDLAGVETQLTGFLEVLAAYTPASGESAFVELGIVQE